MTKIGSILKDTLETLELLSYCLLCFGLTFIKQFSLVLNSATSTCLSEFSFSHFVFFLFSSFFPAFCGCSFLLSLFRSSFLSFFLRLSASVFLSFCLSVYLSYFSCFLLKHAAILIETRTNMHVKGTIRNANAIEPSLC